MKRKSRFCDDWQSSFMGLEITVISSIRLDAEVFSQRIFSIGKRICGFTWGKNGGRNKLLKLNLGPGTMASQLYTHAFNISPIEDRRLCINGTPWIWHLLEECVENAWEYWSVVIGLISIVCFLFAALPQIYVACQNGRVDQALSLGFLLGWIAGDLTNFIGCYLTNQLPIQIVTAIFYVNMDIIMISQFVYYKLKNQKTTKCSKSLKSFCITWIVVCIALCVTLLCQLLLRNKDQSTVIERSNTSLDMIEMSGFICGYISCVFYLGSRFPQLYKNFQRRSTEGTSYLLFALAMVGNCTYGLSLVLKMPATESFRALYFLHHLPWLIGSFGVLFLDIFHCLPARYCHVAGWWWFTFVKTVFWYLLLCTSIYCGNLCFVRCYAYFLAWSREEYIKEGHSWLGYLCSKSIILSESWNHQEKEQVTAQFILYRQHKERESGLVALEVEPLLVNEEAA